MTITPLRGLGAALVISLAASAALAQPPPAAGYGQQNPQRMQRMQEMRQKRQQAMSRDLHAILNIRPDQEAAFAAFQSAAMAPPPPRQRPGDGQMMMMTTPQRIDQMLAKMDERMARMRARAQATKTFYAALGPEQQRAFDALERMHHHHDGGGKERGGWRGGGPGADGRAPPPSGE